MDFTEEEKKIIFNAILYWQMHKAPFGRKDYQICDDLLKRWFNFDNSQKTETSK